MCLYLCRKVNKDKKSGMGFKVVRKTEDPNVFLPLWSYMSPFGGMGEYDVMENSLQPDIRISDIKYKIGEVSVAKNQDKFCISDKSRVQYPAGIHVFLHYRDAKKELRFRRSYRGLGNLIEIIQVEYSNAYLSDRKTIVVKEIKPTNVMNISE